MICWFFSTLHIQQRISKHTMILIADIKHGLDRLNHWNKFTLPGIHTHTHLHHFNRAMVQTQKCMENLVSTKIMRHKYRYHPWLLLGWGLLLSRETTLLSRNQSPAEYWCIVEWYLVNAAGTSCYITNDDWPLNVSNYTACRASISHCEKPADALGE